MDCNLSAASFPHGSCGFSAETLTLNALPGSLTAAGSFRYRTMVFFSFPKPWPGSKAGYQTIKPMSSNLRISGPSILKESYHDRTLGYSA
jgi:hypothetical protein